MILDVPETIPLSKVQAFCADLGFPLDDLIALHVSTDGVYVELWARNADGQHYKNPGEEHAASHRVAIPLDADA